MTRGDAPPKHGSTRKRLLTGAAAAGAGLVLPGATGSALASVFRAPKKSGALYVDLELESPSFNPLLNNYQHLRWVTDQVNETMYVYQGAKIVPLLADGMPKVIDQLNAQVKVKSGIKFNNGHPLTAADVAATFNAARGGVAAAIWKSHLQPLASVTAIDSHTVHFTFKQPWGLLLEKMADIPIVPASAVNVNEKLPGTGPFIFENHVQGQSVTLAANPHYRLGAPKLSQIVFRFVPDAGTRTVNILSGQTHVSPAIPYPNVTQLAKNHKLNVYDVPAPVDLLFWISSQAVPDVRARQALAYAIDRKAVVDTVFGGHAEIGQGPIGPAILGYQYTTKPYGPKPDLTKAKSLLQAAGGGSLSFDYISTTDQVSQTMAQIIAQNWQALGVNVNLQFLELAAWQNSWLSGNWGATCITSLDGVAVGPSPFIATATIQSTNFLDLEKFKDPQVDQDLANAYVTPNGPRQWKYYADASNRSATEVGQLPPAFPNFCVATSKKVHGLPTKPLTQGKLNFYPVSLA